LGGHSWTLQRNCGVCSLAPFVLPAVVLASTGSLLAWFAGAHAWLTGFAVVAVLGAWGWVAWQTVRTRTRPASSTLYLMTVATGLLIVAVLWPDIEPHVVRVLAG
jgi:asparagine N-glycosylation enzyme membrane subunit Stt3